MMNTRVMEIANDMNNFETKKKIVLAGNSKVFRNWSAHSNITKEDFINALEWLCADPLDTKGRMTREIGLTPNGIVKLTRWYGYNNLCSFYHNEEVWSGAIFKRPCKNDREKMFSLDGGKTVEERHKISLSCKDRV